MDVLIIFTVSESIDEVWLIFDAQFLFHYLCFPLTSYFQLYLSTEYFDPSVIIVICPFHVLSLKYFITNRILSPNVLRSIVYAVLRYLLSTPFISS